MWSEEPKRLSENVCPHRLLFTVLGAGAGDRSGRGWSLGLTEFHPLSQESKHCR